MAATDDHGTQLQPVLPGAISEELLVTARAAEDYARKSISRNTRRSYGSDWTDFLAYCKRHNLEPLPAAPQVVALYITALATSVKVGTLERRLAAIGFHHKREGLENPARDPGVRQVLAGIVREHGSPQISKAPATDDVLYRLLSAVEYNQADDRKSAGRFERSSQQRKLRTLRDRVILLLGFAGGFRRSELVAVDVEHLRPDPKGYSVLIPSSKTDQKHAGRSKAIPRYSVNALDPVGAIDEWKRCSGIVSGALLRSFDINGNLTERRLGAGEVSRVIKRAAKRAGLNPGAYAAHSLRSGYVTSAGRRRVNIPDIAEVTHQSVQTVMKYWKAAGAFEDPPLLKIFGEKKERTP